MFVKRTLAKALKNVGETFPVILVIGPRQVGKTTLLEHCAGSSMKYVTLDNLQDRQLALEDPALFIQRYPAPILIDEIQYAPGLLTYIKIEVDRLRKRGMYWLTGSQQFHLMRNVTESLAGRVGILRLLGLSLLEQERKGEEALPFVPTADFLQAMEKRAVYLSLKDLYEIIWRGSFPQVALNPKVSCDVFYSSYVQTYLQRDIRDLARVGNEITFVKFLRAAAARTGQLLNLADLARDTEIDPKTAKSWLSILETSGLVYLLEPYHTNLTKRLVKAPKLYFLDTGLCCHLCKWTSAETLESGAMSGAIFETFMFSEILKSYWHHSLNANFYFYRDKDQKEIDLLIEQDGMLYPIEFKKTATPTKDALKNFSVLKNLDKPIGHGAVVCMSETHRPLTNDVDAIPVGYI